VPAAQEYVWKPPALKRGSSCTGLGGTGMHSPLWHFIGRFAGFRTIFRINGQSAPIGIGILCALMPVSLRRAPTPHGGVYGCPGSMQ
jgi:hypothetical protein